MNIINLDVVAWMHICKYLDAFACMHVANTHPRLRACMRQLAHALMSREDIYSASQPFKRMMQLCNLVQYSIEFDIASNLISPTVTAEIKKNPYNGYYMIGKQYQVYFTGPGAPPPKGTILYITYSPCDDAIPTTIHITLDNAIKQFVNRYYEGYAHGFMKKMSIASNDINYWMENPQMQEWQRQYTPDTPIPFTRENLANHLREHKKWVNKEITEIIIGKVIVA